MCSSMATLNKIWSSGKGSHTQKPQPPASQGRALWAVFASELILVSLMCWAGSEAGCRASGTQNYPRCPLHGCIDAPALQSASPPQPRAMGETPNQQVNVPLPWPLRHLGRKSCAPPSPPHSPDIPASPA